MNDYLETFISVYESRSFSIAAKELFVTQPTVSVRIEQLEKKLGVQLFVRKYRQEIVPTEAGKILYHQAIRMRELWRDTEDEIRYVGDTERHLVRMGFSQTLAVTIAPRFLKSAQQKNPSYDWNITVDNSESILGLIDNKRLDVGLIEKSMLTDTDLVFRRELATDQLVRIGEPTGTWLIREPGSGIEHYTELFFNEYDIKPEHTIMLNRNDLIMELVASGVGETIISKSVLPPDYPYTELNLHFKRSLYFLNSKHMNREILELVYDSVKQIAQEIYPIA